MDNTCTNFNGRNCSAIHKERGGGTVKSRWPQCIRNAYEESSEITSRSSEEVNRYREVNKITVDGENIPRPIQYFSDFSFPCHVMENIQKQNFDQPTPVQAQGWPVVLSGRDFVGIAQTGSGKTLGYILPAVVHIMNQPSFDPGGHPIVVVLSPTRELCLQISRVAEDFGSAADIHTVCIYGGVPRDVQIESLQKGCEICISTPGRLLELRRHRALSLRRCTYFVLDEADQMFNMGFENQVQKLMRLLRRDCQILMWSATWPNVVRSLAREFLKDCVVLRVGSTEILANPNILQIVDVCSEEDKEQKLYNLLEEILSEEEGKIMIFVRRKVKVEQLTRKLNYVGLPALCIHGDQEQKEREWVLEEFRTCRFPILIATDVAGRGWDVEDVKYIINFDYPSSAEAYVHRIGRTARCHKHGTAYTFFTIENSQHAKQLIEVLKEANQVINPRLHTLMEMADQYAKHKKSAREQVLPYMERRMLEESKY